MTTKNPETLIPISEVYSMLDKLYNLRQLEINYTLQLLHHFQTAEENKFKSLQVTNDLLISEIIKTSKDYKSDLKEKEALEIKTNKEKFGVALKHISKSTELNRVIERVCDKYFESPEDSKKDK